MENRRILIFFSAQAKQDFKQIVDRIARDNPMAARRLAAAIKLGIMEIGLSWQQLFTMRYAV